jgi:hypothetical protein
LNGIDNNLWLMPWNHMVAIFSVKMLAIFRHLSQIISCLDVMERTVIGNCSYRSEASFINGGGYELITGPDTNQATKTNNDNCKDSFKHKKAKKKRQKEQIKATLSRLEGELTTSP